MIGEATTSVPIGGALPAQQLPGQMPNSTPITNRFYGGLMGSAQNNYINQGMQQQGGMVNSLGNWGINQHNLPGGMQQQINPGQQRQMLRDQFQQQYGGGYTPSSMPAWGSQMQDLYSLANGPSSGRGFPRAGALSSPAGAEQMSYLSNPFGQFS